MASADFEQSISRATDKDNTALSVSRRTKQRSAKQHKEMATAGQNASQKISMQNILRRRLAIARVRGFADRHIAPLELTMVPKQGAQAQHVKRPPASYP